MDELGRLVPALRACLSIFLLCRAVWAVAADDPVRVFVCGSEVALHPRAAYRDGEVYAPLGILKWVGAACDANVASGRTMNVTASDGTVFESPAKSIRGEWMIPLTAIADKLGAYAEYDEVARALSLQSKVVKAEYADGKFHVRLGFPARFIAREFPNPRRLVLDLPGSRQVGPTETHDIGAPELTTARVGQAEPGTARVVLLLGDKVRWRVAGKSPIREIEIILKRPQSQTPAAPPKPAGIVSMTLAADERDRIELRVSADAPISPRPGFLFGPPRVYVDFPNAELRDNAALPAMECPLIASGRVSRLETKSPTVRVVLELTRIAAYSIIGHGPDEVSIFVRTPDNAGGRMGDVFVVLDPGHGGDDPGTRWGTIREKDVVLTVAELVAEKLQALGAKAKLTRESDVYITLKGRPKVAEDEGAHLFLSLHCNSNGNPGSASGTETYYHKQDPSSRALALAVQKGVAEAIGLPDRGAKSDSLLYTDGLAVLRHATVPAALLEVAFLNHSSDRCKLADPKFQDQVAQGIVNGLRGYVEGEGLGKEEAVGLEASAKP